MTKQISEDLPLKEWDSLPLLVYEKTLSEVKERFEEHADEVENITNKSIKLFVYFCSFIAISCTALSKYKIDFTIIVCILMFLSAANIVWLFSLIKGRDSYYRGLDVKDFLNSEFDRKDFTNDDKEKYVMRNIIIQTQEKIKGLAAINKSRIVEFNYCFMITITLIISICCLIGYHFFYHQS